VELHRPAERRSHRGIEVVDEALDPLPEMLLGCEVAAAEEFADWDREPDLDQPKRMLGCEVKGDPLTVIA
jgi:hypothetical protein